MLGAGRTQAVFNAPVRHATRRRRLKEEKKRKGSEQRAENEVRSATRERERKRRWQERSLTTPTRARSKRKQRRVPSSVRQRTGGEEREEREERKEEGENKGEEKESRDPFGSATFRNTRRDQERTRGSRNGSDKAILGHGYRQPGDESRRQASGGGERVERKERKREIGESGKRGE